MRIGIDVGGSHATIIALNKNEIIFKRNIVNDLKIGYSKLVQNLILVINEILNENEYELESIGVAFPSLINHKTNTIINSVNINAQNESLVNDLVQQFNCRVYLENDASCAAYGEYRAGASKHTESSVTVTLGTGVGVGIIMNGKIYNGYDETGIEMGHQIINFDGPKCKCGRNGCFEVYGSMKNFVNAVKHDLENASYANSKILQLANGSVENINGSIIFEASKQNDTYAEKMINSYINKIAIGVSNIRLSIMPQMIVIGGSVSKQGDYFLNKLNKELEKQVFINNESNVFSKVEIRMAKLGNLAGAIGAALLNK